MASTTTTSKSYSDDLSNVAGITFAETDEGAKAEAGANLPQGQRCGITLTDGEAVWIVDTARSSEVVSLLKAAGTKQKKRGRKASK